MKGEVYARLEWVYYAIGRTDLPLDRSGRSLLAEVLSEGNVERKPLRRINQKDVLYIERVGTAPAHRKDLLDKLSERAERRAAELESIKD